MVAIEVETDLTVTGVVVAGARTCHWIPDSVVAVVRFASAHASLAVPYHLLVVDRLALLVCAFTLAVFTVPELRLNRIVGWVAELGVWRAFTGAIVCVPVLVGLALAAFLALTLASVVTPLHVDRACAWIHAVAGAL